jgi:hypothetical protein
VHNTRAVIQILLKARNVVVHAMTLQIKIEKRENFVSRLQRVAEEK